MNNGLPSTFKPATAADFVGDGNWFATLLLRKLAKAGDAPLKWLFCGPPGCGKTTLADFLAITMAKNKVAIETVNGQSCDIEKVRQWNRGTAYKSMFGERIVQIVNEIDKASDAAANELRSYLDNLPAGHAFIGTSNLYPDRSPTATEAGDPKDKTRKLQFQLQRRMFCYEFANPAPEVLGRWMHSKWPSVGLVKAMDIAERHEGCVASALIDLESAMDFEDQVQSVTT